MSALDTELFDAFNRCSNPEQLKLNESYFAPDVEFYHDNGGVTWSREELKVYPIKNFGAIAMGTHRFCQFDSGLCEGLRIHSDDYPPLAAARCSSR